MDTNHLLDLPFRASDLPFPLAASDTDQLVNMHANLWSLPDLIDFIVKNHHVYVNDALPKILDLLERVVTEYGLQYPELEEVFVTFHALTIHFFAQLRKEECCLFPVIKELVRAKENQKDLAYLPFESIRSQIDDIDEDHSAIEEGLMAIRKLTNNFTAPANACQAYRQLFQWLEAFDKDVYQHEYLENTVLFARALSLEDSMR